MSLDRTFRVKAFVWCCALFLAYAAGWWTGRMM